MKLPIKFYRFLRPSKQLSYGFITLGQLSTIIENNLNYIKCGLVICSIDLAAKLNKIYGKDVALGRKNLNTRVYFATMCNGVYFEAEIKYN